MNKTNTSMPTKKEIGQQEMQFITSVKTSTTPGIRPHSGQKESALAKKAADVKKDFTQVINQLQYIVTEAEKQVIPGHFQLDEITVSLGFSASGKIAFIAEAGVEASIEVTFKRK